MTCKIATVDWIIEVVVEISKKLVFEQVEKYRKPGTITSNTSEFLFTL
jgi:3-hydroxyacyl-CoA dehydrogenase